MHLDVAIVGVSWVTRMTRPRAPRPACLHVLEAVYSGGRSVTTGLRQIWFRLASALYWTRGLDDLCDLLESQIFTRVTWKQRCPLWGAITRSKRKDKVSGIQPGVSVLTLFLSNYGLRMTEFLSVCMCVCVCPCLCVHTWASQCEETRGRRQLSPSIILHLTSPYFFNFLRQSLSLSEPEGHRFGEASQPVSFKHLPVSTCVSFPPAPGLQVSLFTPGFAPEFLGIRTVGCWLA